MRRLAWRREREHGRGHAHQIEPGPLACDVPEIALAERERVAAKPIGGLARARQAARGPESRIRRVFEHAPERAHLLNGARSAGVLGSLVLVPELPPRAAWWMAHDRARAFIQPSIAPYPIAILRAEQSRIGAAIVDVEGDCHAPPTLAKERPRKRLGRSGARQAGGHL